MSVVNYKKLLVQVYPKKKNKIELKRLQFEICYGRLLIMNIIITLKLTDKLQLIAIQKDGLI